jgi:hypothetical protein
MNFLEPILGRIELQCKEIEMFLERILQDTSELRQPLPKEAMAVLTGVRVSITDDVGIGMGNGQMAVHPSFSSIPS